MGNDSVNDLRQGQGVSLDQGYPMPSVFKSSRLLNESPPVFLRIRHRIATQDVQKAAPW